MMKWLIKRYFKTTYYAIQSEGVDEYLTYILKKPRAVQTYTDHYGTVYIIEVRKEAQDVEQTPEDNGTPS